MDRVQIERVFEAYRSEIAEAIPGAKIHLTGSASVADLPAEDIDLVALVSDVASAAAKLRRLYPTLYEDEWREDWAAFRVAGPPQVDVVLTRRGTKGDAHHRLAWDLLREDDGRRAEYAALKLVPDRYPERKAEFFERLVKLLPPNP